MASLLSRFTTFLPNTTILSNDHNQELNRIVQLLNGTTTNLKTVLKTSDAGDPALEVDQLSSGPILELFQGGILKAHFRNDGALNTPAIRDANDNEQLIFTATGSAVNEFTITNAATGNRPALAATGGDGNIGITISPKGTGQITMTGSSPLRLPTAAPTNDNDAARKLYVDDRIVPFVLTYKVDDPSTFSTSLGVLPVTLIPPITGGFITKIKIIRYSGSHTAGGSVTFSANLGSSNIGSGVSFDNTNNAVFTTYTEDFSDAAISEGQALTVVISARSGTISERDVSINVEGFRKVS